MKLLNNYLWGQACEIAYKNGSSTYSEYCKLLHDFEENNYVHKDGSSCTCCQENESCECCESILVNIKND